MIADIILGSNIDTSMWIKDLIKQGAHNIFVINYEYHGPPVKVNGITYLGPAVGKDYFYQFDTLFFYKSMYQYPGFKR